MLIDVMIKSAAIVLKQPCCHENQAMTTIGNNLVCQVLPKQKD